MVMAAVLDEKLDRVRGLEKGKAEQVWARRVEGSVESEEVKVVEQAESEAAAEEGV